jgi:MFS family permease
LTAPAGVASEVLRARGAVFSVFFINGLLMASWISRIPAVRSTLDLSPGQLGLLLLCPAVGSAIALPTAGHVVLRLGARGALHVFSVVCAGGVAVAGAGVSAHQPLLAAFGLFLFGLGTSLWDVAMNVEGAAVEQALRRSIMPRFHAAWSLGSVAGALVGAGFAAVSAPLVVHLLIASAVCLAAAQVACRWFLAADPHGAAEPAPPRAALRAWTERRTLLIGVVTLCAALVEGVANDWFGLTLVDGYHQREVFGALGFGVFVTMMTTGRALGTLVIDRLGRVLTLRLSALAAAVGIILVVVGPWLPIAILGGVLWGAGAALGFPMGMSAAADDPVWSAPRLGVVTSIGYLAFLAGPPLVGFVADEVGVRRAVSVLLVALVLIAVLAPVERPLELPEGAPGPLSGSGDGALTS